VLNDTIKVQMNMMMPIGMYVPTEPAEPEEPTGPVKTVICQAIKNKAQHNRELYPMVWAVTADSSAMDAVLNNITKDPTITDAHKYNGGFRLPECGLMLFCILV
jgi:hypothetical protein